MRRLRSCLALIVLLALALLAPASSVAQFASNAQNTLGCAGQSIINTTFTPIQLTVDTQLITGTAGLRIYLCHVDLVVSAGANVAIVEGTGSVCATVPLAVLGGGKTAATGWNLAANGTLAFGDGNHVIGITATTGDNLCLLRSSGAQISGSIIWTTF